MKSLEKDRTRRYDTANGLALDIQRYLDDEPVQACPPSASYRTCASSRKHRAAIAVAATFAAVLLAAAAVSSWQWREAAAAQNLAVSKADAELQARKNAEESKRAEVVAREKAEAESDAKGKALRQAEGLRLTAESSAILPSNPGLALLLAIAGAKRGAPRQSEHNDALVGRPERVPRATDDHRAGGRHQFQVWIGTSLSRRFASATTADGSRRQASAWPREWRRV